MRIGAGRKQPSQEGMKSTDWLLSSFVVSRASEMITKIPSWIPIFLLGWHHLGTWSGWRHFFVSFSPCAFHRAEESHYHIQASQFSLLYEIQDEGKGRPVPSPWCHCQISALEKKKSGYNPWKILWIGWLNSDFSWLHSKTQILLENAVFNVGRYNTSNF